MPDKFDDAAQALWPYWQTGLEPQHIAAAFRGVADKARAEAIEECAQKAIALLEDHDPALAEWIGPAIRALASQHKGGE